MSWQVIEADCVEAMREMDEASVDAVVTDPPYGLEFMGKEWDRIGDVRQRGDDDFQAADDKEPFGRVRHGGTPSYRAGADTQRASQAWHQAWATEALRVLKPGGFLLAAGGTRTFHRLVSAIEDAGFEIRDCIAHMYGSGFPKSLNVGNGRGTALKPAFEPWTLARKPLIGTVSRNVAEFGTGALNIDGCRIGTDEHWEATGHQSEPSVSLRGGVDGSLNIKVSETHPAGRWPANVALSHLPECERVGERRVKGSAPASGPTLSATESVAHGDYTGERGEVPSYTEEVVAQWRCAPGCAVAELDQQSGERPASGTGSGGNGMGYGANAVEPREFPSYGDTGGAARFFYQAKASRAERNAGLEGFEERENAQDHNLLASAERIHPDGRRHINKPAPPRANSHPTVKPVDLMRWLCRLVTPPDGTVLDPFAGSGTTGIACVLEDFDFIGIEREAEYVEIAKARIAWWDTHKDRADEILALSARSERERTAHVDAGQLGLLE